MMLHDQLQLLEEKFDTRLRIGFNRRVILNNLAVSFFVGRDKEGQLKIPQND